MNEQLNVINLEQETVNKNTDLFVNITEIIGELMKKGLANISLSYQDCAITFSPAQEVQQAFAQYSVERVQSVTDEVIDLTLKLLDNQEQALLKQAQKDGKTVFNMTQKKIALVKKHIVNDKFQRAYPFYRTTIGNVLDQFVAQRVIKPPTENYPSLETVLLKIVTKDNMDQAERKIISFELYNDQIDEIIHILTKLKQDTNLKSNQEPQ